MKQAYRKKHNLLVEEQIIKHEKNDSIRINKYISESGYCSRREADRLVASGDVYVDDVQATTGMRVFEHQKVLVQGNFIENQLNCIYIALHKPIGITCTTDTNIQGSLTNFMNFSERIFPIGRLDKDSSGLLLLTNDGNIVNKILRAEHNHEKEYIVSVHRPIDENFIKSLQDGVEIYNLTANRYEKTKPCLIKKIGPKTCKIILTQGLNRQIRRMCQSLDYRVTSLKRVRIMNIKLQDLQVGEWRYLTKEELLELNQLL